MTKHTKIRRKPTEYSGVQLCEYCGLHQAIYTLVCGKLSCASTAGNCKETRRKAGERISISRNTEVEPGITKANLIANKISQNKRNNIDPITGLDMHQVGGRKSSLNKFQNIDPITGLNMHQMTGLKYKSWCESDVGKEFYESFGKDLSEMMTTVDPTTGLSEAQRRAKLMVNTKLSNVDENGLNSFDRTHWVGGKGGFIEGIYYQSSNEKRFLERMQRDGFLSNIVRGTKISYIFESLEKCYLPDYILGNSLYEIKSKYTMFGPDNKYLTSNLAKLKGAKNAGYKVFVVLDDVTIALEDFIGTVSHLLEG